MPRACISCRRNRSRGHNFPGSLVCSPCYAIESGKGFLWIFEGHQRGTFQPGKWRKCDDDANYVMRHMLWHAFYISDSNGYGEKEQIEEFEAQMSYITEEIGFDLKKEFPEFSDFDLTHEDYGEKLQIANKNYENALKFQKAFPSNKIAYYDI